MRSVEFKYLKLEEKDSEKDARARYRRFNFELSNRLKRVADRLEFLDVNGLIAAVEKLQRELDLRRDNSKKLEDEIELKW